MTAADGGRGTAWQGACGAPHTFTLRIYVPEEDLDPLYRQMIPQAVSPEAGGAEQLAEQLERLATARHGALPPSADSLWTLPSSTAPDPDAEDPAPGEDRPLYHPSQRRRRALHLAEAAETGSELPLVDLLVPRADLESSAAALEAVETRLPLYARQSSWSIPAGWFALFRGHELVRREFRGRTVHRLATTTGRAAGRAVDAAEAVRVLEREDLAELAEDLARLGRWIGSFAPQSLVCLHYGSVADVLQPDESPRDMEDAMAFAAQGDVESMALALRRLVRRWHPLAHLEHAS